MKGKVELIKKHAREERRERSDWEDVTLSGEEPNS